MRDHKTQLLCWRTQERILELLIMPPQCSGKIDRKNMLKLFTILLVSLPNYAAHSMNINDSLEIMSLVKDVLPGKYQTSPLSHSDKSASDRNNSNAYSLTTIIRSLENPKLGQNLYYLEEFRDNDPTNITRIRIYKFWSQKENIYLKLLNPINTDKLIGSHKNLRLVENLSHEDINPDRDVCILALSKLHNKIVARMGTRKCDRENTWIDYELILENNGMWTCFARRTLTDDSLVWLQMLDSPCIYQKKIVESQ